jgi:uncharacterized protein (DUF58 family)
MQRPRPLQAANRWIERWILRRVRRSAGPVTVARQRVYILPTRFGYGFALLSFVMLLGSMNYSNSMGFALTFLMGALGLVCMHHTHANLVGVRVQAGPAAPVFAGEAARFELRLDQGGRRPRYAIGAHWPGEPPDTAIDIPLRGSASAFLTLETRRRGWLPAGVFSLATDYPLGLFRAWTFVELAQRVLVYPQPTPARLAPPLQALVTQGDSRGGRPGQEQFAGLRSYQRGDPLNLLHWKSLPKSQAPMVKQFEDPQAPECWLDLAQTPGTDLEARIALLARWVIDLEAAGARYGLRLPEQRLALDQGPEHRHRCLQALALHGGPA